MLSGRQIDEQLDRIERLRLATELRAAGLAEGETSRFLFPSRGRTGHLTRQRFAQLLKEAALAAGIDPARVQALCISEYDPGRDDRDRGLAALAWLGAGERFGFFRS